MCCSLYDQMEPGAPTFNERLEMLRKLSANCKRVIARVQPYIVDVRKEFVAAIPQIAETGAYGITLEGMKFKRKKPGLVRVRGDYCYPENVLKQHYEQIREVAHKNGLHFFCAENRLRGIGDSTSCCGCGDLEGFEGNKFNLVSMAAGGGLPLPANLQSLKKKGTGTCFRAIHQNSTEGEMACKRSFYEQMLIESKRLKL